MGIAFIFPGQGSQIVGMGKGLAEEYPAAREVFAKADEALGFELSRLCWEGPEDELKKTYNTQPAILTTSIACLEAFKSRCDLAPAVVAGHSVGEYAALVAAEVLQFEDAVRLTRLRGQLMEAACPKGTGGMAAVVGGIPMERVEQLCRGIAEESGFVLEPAGYNCPEQIVVAGHIRALSELLTRVKAEGARNATLLSVSGPFHSSLMAEAKQPLRERLDALSMSDAAVPVVCNVDASPHTKADELKENLVEQLVKPVLWEKSVRWMMDNGVKEYVEFGAGRVLAGLLRRIDRSLKTQGVRDVASLEKTLDHFKAVGLLD